MNTQNTTETKTAERNPELREESIEKGCMVRLCEPCKDRSWVRVRSVHPSGTAVVLSEPRDGYSSWNIGDVELESRAERHTRLAKEVIGFWKEAR